MRLKSLLFTLLLLTGFSMAKAEIVHVGASADNVSDTYLPTQINYNFSLTQQIYRYYELFGISTISSISFYNASTAATRTVDIYLKDADQASFSSGASWNTVTDGDKYFSGNVTFQQGEWTTITLNQAFTHDSNKNLIVTMDDNTGTYTSSKYFKMGVNTEAYKTLYLYRDGSDYDVSQMSSYTGYMSDYRNQIRINGEEKIYGLPNASALPTHGWYRYALSQQIYTQSEIGKKGFINSIALKNLSYYTMKRDIDVYLVPTSKTEFSSTSDWVSVQESNLVFSGEVNFVKDEWTQIKFPEPFYYNGTGNLAVVVNDHTGSYYTTVVFSAYQGSGNQSISVWNDSNGAYDATNLSSVSGNLFSMKNQIQFEFDDDLYIGDGGSSTFSYLPTNTYYNYSLSQQIYTKEEIGGAKDLTSISFYNTASLERVRNLNIYLVPTYADKFDDGNSWISFSESNLVFSGDVTFYEEDWTTIPFDNTYSFNGMTNLALVIADNTGSYQSGYLNCRVFNATQQSLYKYSDSTTPEDMTSIEGNVYSYKNQIKLNAVDTDPARPENLHAEDIQPYQATIVWEGEGDTWQFQYKKSTDSDWTEVMETSNSYTMTGLLPLSKYYVRVKALFDDGSASKWTPTEFITISTTPTDLAATTTPTTATLNWTGYGEEYDVMYVNLEKYNQIFFEDFEGGFGSNGWTTIANGTTPVTDGWELSPSYNNYTSQSYCFSGSNSPASYSWIDSPTTAYNADNWLISPLVDLKGTLSFWMYTANANEQYEVKLSTSGTDVSDFVFTLRPMGASAVGYWHEVRIDLSDYEGEQGHIAIHHQQYDGIDLRIDDFCIFEGEMGYVHSTGTEATIEGLEPNTEYACLVLSHKKGEASVSSNLLTFTTMENNPAPFDLAATPDLRSADISWDGFSDSYKVRYRTPEVTEDIYSFFDDFENGFEDKGWTIYTQGEKHPSAENGWIIRTITENVEDWNIPSGNSFAYAQSYDNDEGAFHADNWLVSPQLDLKGTLKFWERAQDSSYPDKFEVLLSTTGNEIADFTTELRPMGPGSDSGWNQVEIDLSAYEGQQGYIAIHHVDYDMFWLDIDDFGIVEGSTVITPAGEWQETEVTTDKYITIEGLEKGTKYEYQVIGMKEGEEDAVSESAYFTTIAPVDLVLYTNGDNGSAIYNNDGLYTNVTIQGRTFKNDGKWWSICLPFDLELEGSILEGSDLRQPEDFKEVDTYLVIDCLTPLTKIEAGKPYMIKYNGTEDIVDPVFEEVVIKYGSESNIYLNSDKIAFCPLYFLGDISSPVDNFYIMDGNLRLGRLNLQKDMALPAFDCYFWVDETYNSGLDGIGLNFGDIDLLDLITGVEKVESSEEPANIYNVAGQRLSKKQKGINIIGDKKVFIK